MIFFALHVKGYLLSSFISSTVLLLSNGCPTFGKKPKQIPSNMYIDMRGRFIFLPGVHNPHDICTGYFPTDLF